MERRRSRVQGGDTDKISKQGDHRRPQNATVARGDGKSLYGSRASRRRGPRSSRWQFAI